jgi:hypothetical protein
VTRRTAIAKDAAFAVSLATGLATVLGTALETGFDAVEACANAVALKLRAPNRLSVEPTTQTSAAILFPTAAQKKSGTMFLCTREIVNNASRIVTDMRSVINAFKNLDGVYE